MQKNLLTKTYLPHQKPVAQSKSFVASPIVLDVPEVMVTSKPVPVVTPLPQSEEILNKPIAPSEKKMSTQPTPPTQPTPTKKDEELTIIEEPYIPGSIMDISDTETVIGNSIIE